MSSVWRLHCHTCGAGSPDSHSFSDARANYVSCIGNEEYCRNSFILAVEAGICSARLRPYIRLRSSWFPDPDANIYACVPGAAFIRSRRGRKIRAHTRMRNLSARSSSIARLALAMLLVSCASIWTVPRQHRRNPNNSVRGPADGRYKLAFIEFGDQGSPSG